MPRSQRNDNFIDKTFTVIADILIKVLPTSNREKEAFSYYRDGMSAQSEGEYAEALQNYYQALRLEIDPYDRSYILYNIGRAEQALENGQSEISKILFQRAADYWNEAIRLAPTSYLEAQSWLKQKTN
uniref:photosystem I assembly protein Ycf3 n=1 Tax=Symbiochloris sp. SG-2018 TaxID=2126034 RepID=UPI0021150E2F|nr:photosystem I assembly protein Ycf3 [Symbiochloris sp. SG-2018]UTQ75738.1 photosystem I assembly protein Ycf3 [Symbiochloris sp. SG-2018]